jgi:hypothetical protein
MYVQFFDFDTESLVLPANSFHLCIFSFKGIVAVESDLVDSYIEMHGLACIVDVEIITKLLQNLFFTPIYGVNNYVNLVVE